MEHLFSGLYSLVALFTVIAYLPQIVSLLRADTPVAGMSVSTWILWTLSGAVSFGYGVFCLDDMRFCVVTGSGLALMLVVTALLIHNRYIRFTRPARSRIRSRA